MKLEIHPIHGWGWFDAAGPPLEVPPTFCLEVTVTQAGNPFTSALGQVTAPGHPLAGLWVVLSRRQMPFEMGFDGHCNLFAFDHKPAVPKISEALADKPVLTGSVSIDSIAD